MSHFILLHWFGGAGIENRSRICAKQQTAERHKEQTFRVCSHLSTSISTEERTSYYRSVDEVVRRGVLSFVILHFAFPLFSYRMNIVCVICREYFIPSDDISFTRCGHVFHSNCLSQWLTRSSSCPQCRETTRQDKVRKLYITFSSNETDSDNLPVQDRIENLNFKNLLNEKHIKYYISKNEILEKQNAGLRQEVLKVESEINQKNSTIYALKEQMRETHSRYQTLKHKLSKYKKKEVEKIKDFKTLLYGSDQDTKEIIEKTKERDTFLDYISATKEEIARNVSRNKLLCDYLKEIHGVLLGISTDIEALGREESKESAERCLAAWNWTIQEKFPELPNVPAVINVIPGDIYLMRSCSRRKSNEVFQ